MRGKQTDAARTFNAVQFALVMKVAMDTARIFDISNPARFPLEKQDKASVPVLAALMARADVQAALCREAANWTAIHQDRQQSNCQAAIENFIEAAARVSVEGSDANAAMVRLRQFRDMRLAHALFDKKPDTLPFYGDLDLLLDIAAEAITHAAIAIEGLNIDFAELTALDRENAEHFSQSLAEGIIKTEDNLD